MGTKQSVAYEPVIVRGKNQTPHTANNHSGYAFQVGINTVSIENVSLPSTSTLGKLNLLTPNVSYAIQVNTNC